MELDRVRLGWGRLGWAGQGWAGQGRAGQGRAGLGRAEQGRAGQSWNVLDWIVSFCPELTQTHGQGFAPGSIGLTHGGLVAYNGHVGEAAKDDGGAKSRALLDVFQPPVR